MGADPVTVGIIAGGAVLNMYGQREANRAEAKARRANAAAYAEQKRLSLMAARREADIHLDEAASFVGEQISMFARSGVDLSGSALIAVASTKEKAAREHSAIMLGSQARSRMFDIAARQEMDVAKRLNSSSYNWMQNAQTLLNAGGTAMMLSNSGGHGNTTIVNPTGGGGVPTSTSPIIRAQPGPY